MERERFVAAGKRPVGASRETTAGTWPCSICLAPGSNESDGCEASGPGSTRRGAGWANAAPQPNSAMPRPANNRHRLNLRKPPRIMSPNVADLVPPVKFSLGAPASRRPVSSANTPAGRQRSRQSARQTMSLFVQDIIPQTTTFSPQLTALTHMIGAIKAILPLHGNNNSR